MLEYIASCFLLLSGVEVRASDSTPLLIGQEKPILQLYYTPYCPYSRKVLNYLKQIHKKVPLINLQNNPQGKEELKRIGGILQVPCLVVNGHPIYNDEAIIEWLSTNKDFLDPI